jgi:hypothetical protein
MIHGEKGRSNRRSRFGPAGRFAPPNKSRARRFWFRFCGAGRGAGRFLREGRNEKQNRERPVRLSTDPTGAGPVISVLHFSFRGRLIAGLGESCKRGDDILNFLLCCAFERKKGRTRQAAKVAQAIERVF